MLDLLHARDRDAAERIRECAIQLLMRSRLFGLMILGSAIRVRESFEIERMCTDGRTIWYHPAWVKQKPAASIMFDLLHEGLHVYGNHPARRGDRDPQHWNWAADARVAHDGLAICRAVGPWDLDADHIPNYGWTLNLSVEQIYDRVVKDSKKFVPKGYKSDLIEPKETPDESAEFRRKLTQDLAQGQIAEEEQQLAGSKKTIERVYGSRLWERLQELKRCEVPWNLLLQGRLCAAFGHDTSAWVPPNRKWFPEIAIPSRKGSQEEELLLGVDVSGSIDNADLARFRACILPAARRAKKTTVVTFDAVVRERFTTARPQHLLKNITFQTGAHSYTDVRGVFEEVDARRPTAVAILTDGFIKLPDKPYPHTHWILKPGGAEQPWGRHYRFHTSW